MAHNMADYEAERRSFALTAPADFNWAFDVVDRWAEDAQKQAMFWVGPSGEERQITFDTFRRRSNQLANGLEQLGVRPGDRVFLMLPRLVEWWESILGIMRVAAVSMPGTTLLTPKDIAYRANLAEARVVITDAANSAQVRRGARAVPIDRDPDRRRRRAPGLAELRGAARGGWRGLRPHPATPAATPV